MTETAPARVARIDTSIQVRTKLIEVALPLEAINREAAREKSIRHGHPSTLHLWWARRPLAACRAVLFAQLVDDPSAVPEEFPTEEEQEAERQRLFRIIEELVKWENSNTQAVLTAAQREIARSVARAAGVSRPETEDDIWRILREYAPPLLDPFCGSGSIPLEAQRLGLEAHASDLNPVAVLITKALVEIPPKFAGMPPVNPEARKRLVQGQWTGASGLAEDIRYYGKWMRDEAWKRIGHLYPRVRLPKEQGGGEATVIAWLWARTVKCPNPACGAQMPLVTSFWLSTKKGKETWIEPIIDRGVKRVRFEVRSGTGGPPEPPKTGRGAKFRCLVCGNVADDDHVKAESKAGGLGQQLMAVVGEGQGRRMYVAPTDEQVAASRVVPPGNVPTQPLADDPRAIWCVGYGVDTFDKLFTPRQLVALTTFSDLISDARERAKAEAVAAGLDDEILRLNKGDRGASGYADAVATYLALAVDRLANYATTICTWHSGVKYETLTSTFARQALPMTWDFAEGNPFSESSGNMLSQVAGICVNLVRLPCSIVSGEVSQLDAMGPLRQKDTIVSTDPPYYDNIGYADLSDFFYVWLRRSLRGVYPDLFDTILTPKAHELVAIPYRFQGGKQQAETFFQEGLKTALRNLRVAADARWPLTIYYAFRQAEADVKDGTMSSTGWATMLTALLEAGLSVTGTWPMRTELVTNLKKNVGALASSIVLTCRPRWELAPSATRRELVSNLRHELPAALRALQHGNIVPVDLAQASIGPGMAVFSRYAKVLEADGSPMSVRTALQIINQELERYLTEQEGELDPDTRFCVAWFEQYSMDRAKHGEADVLARAKDTSVDGLVRAGVLEDRGGNVRLLARSELGPNWDPLTDRRITDWECCQHLILALNQGEDAAARLALRMGAGRAQTARDLAYRLYSICDRKDWAEEALAYNGLVASWPPIQDKMASLPPEQGTLI